MKKLLLFFVFMFASAVCSQAFADECVFKGTYWDYTYEGNAPCQTWPTDIKDIRSMENDVCEISWNCPIGGLMPIQYLDWVEKGVMTIAPRPGIEITSVTMGFIYADMASKLADPAEFTPSSGSIAENGITSVWTGSATHEMPLTLTKLTQNPLNSMTYVLVEYNRDALKSWVFNGTGEGRYTGDAPQTALSDLDLSAAANLEVPDVCSLSWPAGQLSVVDGALCWNSAGIMTLTCQKDVAVKEIIFSFSGPGQTQSLQMVFNVTVSSGTFYVNNDRINEAQWLGTANAESPMELTNWMQTPITDIQYIEVKYVAYKKPLELPVFESESGVYLLGHEVTISSADEARIFYSSTLDGNAVDTDKEYTGPITLDRIGKWEISAYSAADGIKSNHAKANYSIVSEYTKMHGVILKGEKEIKNDNEYEVFTLPLDIAEKNCYKIEGVCELLWNDGSFGYRPTSSTYLRIDKDAEISIVPSAGITIRKIIVVGAPYTDSTRALSAAFDKGDYTYDDTTGTWTGEVSDRLTINTKREFYYMESMTIEYSEDGTGTGVDNIVASDAPAAYYRLDGTRINSAPTSGIYIRVIDGKAEKLLAR